ncbi:MAG: hypothetical protein U0R80_19240 [Nocardioidaceae bacterium]
MLGRLFYDTAVFDPVALRRLVEDVGGGQVVVGTDHPYDLAERDPVAFVRSAGLDAGVVDEVLGGTASRLLGLG